MELGLQGGAGLVGFASAGMGVGAAKGVPGGGRVQADAALEGFGSVQVGRGAATGVVDAA